MTADTRTWQAFHPVLHLISREVGKVVAVDFDEQLAAVAYSDNDHRWARLENLTQLSLSDLLIQGADQ